MGILEPTKIKTITYDASILTVVCVTFCLICQIVELWILKLFFFHHPLPMPNQQLTVSSVIAQYMPATGLGPCGDPQVGTGQTHHWSE